MIQTLRAVALRAVITSALASWGCMGTADYREIVFCSKVFSGGRILGQGIPVKFDIEYVGINDDAVQTIEDYTQYPDRDDGAFFCTMSITPSYGFDEGEYEIYNVEGRVGSDVMGGQVTRTRKDGLTLYVYAEFGI